MTGGAPTPVQRSWRCKCGHHRLHHYWNTVLDPAGTNPLTTFEHCVDAEPCDCQTFTAVEPGVFGL